MLVIDYRWGIWGPTRPRGDYGASGNWRFAGAAIGPKLFTFSDVDRLQSWDRSGRVVPYAGRFLGLRGLGSKTLANRGQVKCLAGVAMQCHSSCACGVGDCMSVRPSDLRDA